MNKIEIIKTRHNAPSPTQPFVIHSLPNINWLSYEFNLNEFLKHIIKHTAPEWNAIELNKDLVFI